MAAYVNALHSVTLSGPTLFSHVIHRAAGMAAEATANYVGKYFVLLIITVRQMLLVLYA